MKTSIVKFSDLNMAECISPKQFCHSCEDCNKVMKCKYPEAREGRIKILDKRIRNAKIYLESLKMQREEL